MGLGWVGSDLKYGDRQAGPCMGRCMGWCMVSSHGLIGGAWVGVLPVLVRLGLGVGGGLDGDGEEVVGVVSCEVENYL